MRYEKCQGYIKLYYDIDAKIVYAKQKGKVIGRAIVWPTNEGYLLDRIYGCDDTVRYSILEYAKNEIGIAAYKEKDAYDDPDGIVWVDGVTDKKYFEYGKTYDGIYRHTLKNAVWRYIFCNAISDF